MCVPVHTHAHIHILHIRENNNFNRKLLKEKTKKAKNICLWPFTLRVLFVFISPGDIKNNGENRGC